MKYEIKKSWSSGDKGVLGIRIHRLLDHELQPCIAGPNPFDQLIFSNGQSMSSVIKLYDPPHAMSADVYAISAKISHSGSSLRLRVVNHSISFPCQEFLHDVIDKHPYCRHLLTNKL